MPATTVTSTPAQATRIASCLGEALGLIDAQGAIRTATLAEYNDWLRDMTKRMVQAIELRRAEAALAPPTPLDLT